MRSTPRSGHPEDPEPASMHVTVRVKGAIGRTLVVALDDVEVRTETVLTSRVSDDAALHALLVRLGDLGLRVVDVHASTLSRAPSP